MWGGGQQTGVVCGKEVSEQEEVIKQEGVWGGGHQTRVVRSK